MLAALFFIGSLIGGLLTLNRSADLLNVQAFTFPPGFFVWAVLFLVFGYLLLNHATTDSTGKKKKASTPMVNTMLDSNAARGINANIRR